MNVTLLIFSLILNIDLPAREVLLAPFGGFDEQGMAPIWTLFQSSSEGRHLISRSVKRLGLRRKEELVSIFSFCGNQDSGYNGPERRSGLFRFESGVLFRLQDGDREWRSVTAGALECYQARKQVPLLASRSRSTANFELMDLAFQPSICVKSGLRVFEVWLVLTHELTHMVNTIPFEAPDLFFDQKDPTREFYYPTLEKPGGESEAYIAQLKALQQLQDHSELEITTTMDGFLTKSGRLSFQNRPIFLDLLLDDAGYRGELDYYLAQQVVREYNQTQFLWELLTANMEYLDKQLARLEDAEARLEQAVREAGAPLRESDRQKVQDQRAGLAASRQANRDRYQRFAGEAAAYEALMERLDRVWPEE